MAAADLLPCSDSALKLNSETNLKHKSLPQPKARVQSFAKMFIPVCADSGATICFQLIRLATNLKFSTSRRANREGSTASGNHSILTHMHDFTDYLYPLDIV